jgi:hypothetical protein
MNKAVFGRGKDEKTIRRGLDGIRDYIKLRGAHSLQSDNFGSFLDALNAPKDRVAQNARLTRNDILGGRETFKQLLKSQLLEGRASALRRGAGKLALGGGAIAGGGALLAPLLAQVIGRGDKSPTNGLGRGALLKAASDDAAIAGGAGAALLGAGLYDTGRSFGKIKGISRPYLDATNAYLKDYPDLMYSADPRRMERFLDVMDTYADSAKQMSNLRVMGVPAHYLTRRFPLASIASDWKSTLLHGLGMSGSIAPEKRWKILDVARHYQDAATAPRALFAREMLSHTAGPHFRIGDEAAKVMDFSEAKRIIDAPESVSLRERFAPYIDRVKARQVPGTAHEINSPFFYREKRMLRGLHDWHDSPLKWDPRSLQKHMRSEGIKGYGLRLGSIGGRLSPRLKVVGGLLAALGLGAAGNGVHSKMNADPTN